MFSVIAAPTPDSGTSFADVATWIGGIAGFVYLLDFFFGRWLRGRLRGYWPRSRKALPLAADVVGFIAAIALFFVGTTLKIALVVVLGIAGATRIFLDWRAGRSEPSSPTATPQVTPPVAPRRPQGVSERDWHASRMTGTEIKQQAPPSHAEIQDAFAGLIDDLGRDDPDKVRPSNLARMVVEARKDSVKRGQVLLRRHYDEGRELQRRLRIPPTTLTRFRRDDEAVVSLREAIEWVTHLSRLLHDYALDKVLAFRIANDELRAEIKGGRVAPTDAGQEFVDRNMRFLKTLLMDRGERL